ncbi:MAG: hypothetical protein ABW148_18590 [Sedimenticola sp.]
MDTKHNIQLSAAFSDKVCLIPKLRVYISGFMKWLLNNGHVVEFSSENTTLIDGENVHVIDSRANEIYANFHVEYTNYLEVNKS